MLDKNTFGKGKLFEDFADIVSKKSIPSDRKKIQAMMKSLKSDSLLFLGKFDIMSKYYKIMRDYYLDNKERVALSDPYLQSMFNCVISAKLRMIFNKKL